MNKLVKSALVVFPVAALVAGFSVQAVAHDKNSTKRGGQSEGATCQHGKRNSQGEWGSKSGKMGGERMLMMLNYKLDLSDAQEVSMKAIFERQKSAREGHQGAGAALYDELAELEMGSAEYNAQVDKIAQSQAAMMAAHMKARAQMQVNILAVLNDEQKAEFDKIMQRFERQKHGKGKKSKDKKTHSH